MQQRITAMLNEARAALNDADQVNDTNLEAWDDALTAMAGDLEFFQDEVQQRIADLAAEDDEDDDEEEISDQCDIPHR
jgi:hypothetical protein